MEFVAIDVETANSNMASICQIGVAKFSKGKLVEEWCSLIDPEDYFDPMNIYIHGIDERSVVGKPTFLEITGTLKKYLESSICVSHMPFDQRALDKAFRKYGIEPFAIVWIDSAKVARRTWSDVAKKGYGLSNLCNRIGYSFKHHDALEDAKAAGHVLLAAMKETNLDLDGWKQRIKMPIGAKGAGIAGEGNPEGGLFGEVAVITGTFVRSQPELSQMARDIGCNVAKGVTKKTTMLIVGDRDVGRYEDKEKSNKREKAEKLVKDGQKILFLTESDFMELVTRES